MILKFQQITLLALLLFVFSCEKKEEEPVYVYPKFTIEKITQTDTIVEGSGDTIYFKVALDDFYDYREIELFIDYGYSQLKRDRDLILEKHNLGEGSYHGVISGDVYNDYFKIIFNKGEKEKIIALKRKDNNFYEKGKEVRFKIDHGFFSKNSGGKPKNFNSENLFISYKYEDNDFPPFIGFYNPSGADTIVSEKNGLGSWVIIKLDVPSALETRVEFNVSGSATSADYLVKTSTPLIIPPFATEGKIFIDIINDNVYESSKENIEIMLSSPVNAILGNIGNSKNLKDSRNIIIEDEEDK